MTAGYLRERCLAAFEHNRTGCSLGHQFDKQFRHLLAEVVVNNAPD